MGLARVLVLMMVAVLAATAQGCGAGATTVLLVRHAEKGPGRDPDLTGEGRRRSLALVELARQAGVAATYHTQFKRTAQTAEPVATHLGVPLIPIEYAPGKEQEHADALIASIRRLYSGKTVLIVGHSTTIPVILRKLGVESTRKIPETEYGTLFVVVEGTVREGRFGH